MLFYSFLILCLETVKDEEYLKALRERHNVQNEVKGMKVETGDVVPYKGDKQRQTYKNRYCRRLRNWENGLRES